MAWTDYIPFRAKKPSPASVDITKSVGMPFAQANISKEGRQALGISMAPASGAPKTAHDRIHMIQTHPVAFWCVRKIAWAAASVPWVIDDGNGNAIKNHPLADLLARPNPRQSRSEFFQLIASSLACTGNAYITPISSAMEEAKLTALYALRPDRVTIQRETSDTSVVRTYNYHVGGRGMQIITPDKMCHIRHQWLTDEVEGYAALNSSWESLATYSGFLKLVRKILDNSGGIPGMLVFSSKEGMSDDQRSQMQEYVNRFKLDGDKFGELLLADVGDGDLKFVALAGNMSGLDQKATKAESAREICLSYGVPPNLYMSEEQRYSNYQEANRVFWMDTVIPGYLEPIARSLSRFFGVTVRADLTEVPALSAFNAETLTNLASADFLSINEKRAKLGYHAVPMGSRIIVNPAAIALDTQMVSQDARVVLTTDPALLTGILEADAAAMEAENLSKQLKQIVDRIGVLKAKVATDSKPPTNGSAH